MHTHTYSFNGKYNTVFSHLFCNFAFHRMLGFEDLLTLSTNSSTSLVLLLNNI